VLFAGKAELKRNKHFSFETKYKLWY